MTVVQPKLLRNAGELNSNDASKKLNEDIDKINELYKTYTTLFRQNSSESKDNTENSEKKIPQSPRPTSPTESKFQSVVCFILFYFF